MFSEAGGRQTPDRGGSLISCAARTRELLSVLEAIAVTRYAGRSRAKTRNDERRLRTALPPTARVGAFFPSGGKRTTAATETLRAHGTGTVDGRFRLGDFIAPPARRSADLSSNCWNRVELYNEVWNQPLVKLARKYGISDVRLGKVCRKLKIPHPGRGYWAKRAVGQAVEQVPLPEFKDAPVVRRLKLRRTVVGTSTTGQQEEGEGRAKTCRPEIG